MDCKAVVFDLDGTLLDTLEDIADAANKVLAEHNFPLHNTVDYRTFVGEGVNMLMTRAVPYQKNHIDTIDDCCKAFREIYKVHWNKKTKPYDGVAEMLDELTARKLPLAVLSNKPDDFTKKCVAELLHRWTFQMVQGSCSNIPYKPDPTGARHIADALGIPPANILYLGDTGTDMRTAVNAGMFPVGVLWGYRTREELQSHGAKALIEQPRELLTLLSPLSPKEER
jgi:phosphoglycolate phosphatase